MADIALGCVPRIIDIALKIKEAVKNVKQNEKDCRDIERCVARVTALIKRLDEVTEAMKEEVMRDALEDLAESLEGALELVTKCQRKHVVRRFIGAGDMAKELRLVQDDILRKVTIGSFATNVVQLGITLMTIAQAAPAPQRHQQVVATEKPSHMKVIVLLAMQVTQRMYWPFYFRIIQEIAQGLHYIHEQNVVHGDIKPENILFDSDMNPVIFDFGISTVLDNEDYIYTEQIIGSLAYMASEYIDKGIVSKKGDVFAFGVVILRTILGRPYWDWYSELDYEVLEEDVEKMMEFFDTKFVEESELPEVERCLKVGLLCREFDPAKRPTMAEVLDMLNGEKELPDRKNKQSIN